MRIAISGATGLIGTALSSSLTIDGHEVIAMVRRPVADGERAITWDPANGTSDRAALEGVDAIVNLAGAGIGDHRWTDSYRREILDSRVRGTSLIAETIATLDRRPSVLINGSAIGYYGDTGDGMVDESAPAGDDFLARVCVEWEAATAPAEAAGIRVAHLRTGVVLSPSGGAMGKMLPLFRLGLGGRMGSGRQWWSWITLADEVAAIRWLLDHPISGPVDATAPNPVTNREFTSALGTALHRPTILPVPRFGPRLLLGRELADALLFTSQRVVPAVLNESGFVFAHPTIDVALTAITARTSRA